MLANLLAPVGVSAKSDTPPQNPDTFVCGTSAARQRDALARGGYRESRQRRAADRRPLSEVAPVSVAQFDVGDVAVIEDDGTLIVQPNPFDLSLKAFRFVPSGTSTYNLEAVNKLFDASGSTPVILGDDDSALENLGFAFTFYGQTYSSVYLNSDGNLTFLQPDSASSARDLGRFSSGPPRIGPLFSDLDPPLGGIVSVRNDPDGLLFAWSRVPIFGSSLSISSFSVKLYNTGIIEFVYGQVSSPSDVVGISPGAGAGGISAIDYSIGLPASNLPGTIAEVFVTQASVTETAVAKRFFQTHPDSFDHLTMFLGFPMDLGGGAFAFELPVKNEIEGINLDIMDSSAAFGSNGRLRSFLNMGSLDGIGRYPNDPNQIFLGSNSTITIMGQESGHRWLAFTPWMDGTTISNTILGRDLAHWSFFFNSNASVMEGNAIADNGAMLGNQRFTTVAATDTYSLLDQYMIGLVGKEDVPNSFVVENPTGTFMQPASAPRTGVVFGGTRKDVSIDAIIAANGTRVPSTFQAPKVFRQGFILLVPKGQTATQEQIAKVQAIRDAWVTFFNAQTEQRGWVVTNLQETPGTTPNKLLFPSFLGDSQHYTGIALANWGPTPTDVQFTAYDNSGNQLSAPSNIINPRVITIAPGAQMAMLAEQIHGLALTDPRNGWIQADAGSSQVTGFFVYGDIDQTFLDGAVAGSKISTSLYFTRGQVGTGIAQNKPYKNLIVVVNPDVVKSAQLSFRLFNEFGALTGTASRTLGPRQRLAEDLSSLFPQMPQPTTKGYVVLTSDLGVIGYQSIDSGTSAFSLPAQAASGATTLYSAQFASGSNGVAYFTDINLINTSTQSRNIQILLVGDNGAPVSGITNPVNINLAPGAQYRTRGENIFGLPDAALLPAIVEGSVVVTADGQGIVGDVVFGDPVAEKFVAALPLDGTPVTDFVLSQVAQGSGGGPKPYFTGVALYNPNANDINVTLDVYADQGSKTGSSTFVLPARSRIAKTLPQLVPAITSQIRGYMRVTASGGPVVSFELFGDQASDFIAPVPPQPITP